MSFNFKEAQEYEFKYAVSWIDQYGEGIFEDIRLARADNQIKRQYFDLFFENNTRLWDEFVNHVKDKNCLEVSSGPCGIFPFWQHWLTGWKIIIDPLIHEYENYLIQKFGKSWFDHDVDIWGIGAEMRLERLINKIDGFILFRNGIDHFEKPFEALQNISDYAAPGCILLFWGDIKHNLPTDQGHIQVVCEQTEEFEKRLIDMNWKVIRHTPKLRDANTLEYGCVAVKQEKMPQMFPSITNDITAPVKELEDQVKKYRAELDECYAWLRKASNNDMNLDDYNKLREFLKEKNRF